MQPGPITPTTNATNPTPVSGAQSNSVPKVVSASEVKNEVKAEKEKRDKCPIVKALREMSDISEIENRKFSKIEVNDYLEEAFKTATAEGQKVVLLTSIDMLAYKSIDEKGLVERNRYALEFLLIKLFSRIYKDGAYRFIDRWYTQEDESTKKLLVIAAHQGLYEFLMVLMSFDLYWIARTKDVVFEKDSKNYTLITYTLLAFKDNKLNLAQTVALLERYKQFGLTKLQGKDLAIAIETKNVDLVAFLLKNYKRNLGDAPKNGVPPIEQAVTQVATEADWRMVDLLLESGADLNKLFTGMIDAYRYSPLLKKLAAEGRIFIVKGLIYRYAACAFESKKFSALPEGLENATQDQIRTRHYLVAVRALHQSLLGTPLNSDEESQIYNNIDAQDKSDFEAYKKKLEDSKQSKTTLVKAETTSKGSYQSASIEVKQEVKKSENDVVADAENPLLKTVKELEKSEDKFSPADVTNKLELAYQAMLEVGVFDLVSAIEHLVQLNLELRFSVHVLTKIQKVVLNYLLIKFASLYPDPEVNLLLKKTSKDGKKLFHVAISEGLYDFVMLVLENTDRSKYDLLMRESDGYSSINLAVLAFNNGNLSLFQVIKILEQFTPKQFQLKDIEVVIATKNLTLIQEVVTNFKEKPFLKLAITQAQTPADWRIVDFFLEQGMRLNEPASFIGSVIHCPVLKEMVALGRLDAVKELLLREAACAFGTSYSVLQAEEKVSNNEDMNRIRTYLMAVQSIRANNWEQAKLACKTMCGQDKTDLMTLFKNDSRINSLFENHAQVQQAEPIPTVVRLPDPSAPEAPKSNLLEDDKKPVSENKSDIAVESKGEKASSSSLKVNGEAAQPSQPLTLQNSGLQPVANNASNKGNKTPLSAQQLDKDGQNLLDDDALGEQIEGQPNKESYQPDKHSPVQQVQIVSASEFKGIKAESKSQLKENQSHLGQSDVEPGTQQTDDQPDAVPASLDVSLVTRIYPEFTETSSGSFHTQTPILAHAIEFKETKLSNSNLNQAQQSTLQQPITPKVQATQTQLRLVSLQDSRVLFFSSAGNQLKSGQNSNPMSSEAIKQFYEMVVDSTNSHWGEHESLRRKLHLLALQHHHKVTRTLSASSVSVNKLWPVYNPTSSEERRQFCDMLVTNTEKCHWGEHEALRVEFNLLALESHYQLTRTPAPAVIVVSVNKSGIVANGGEGSSLTSSCRL